MGFFNDFIRGATPAIAGGTDIGLRGMAEAQRRKEEAEIQRRNAEQQAFMNLMRLQELERLNQRDAIGDQQWQRTFDANNFATQQAGVNALTNDINTFVNNQADNVRADKRLAWEMSQPKSVGGQPSFQEQMLGYIPEADRQTVANTYFGLESKAGTTRQISPNEINAMYSDMYENWKYGGGEQDGLPEPTIQDAISRAQMIMNSMNPQQQQQQPIPDAGNVQRVPMGAQGGPVRLVGGQPQTMPQRQLHPALQKMVQDGLTKQDILNDYMANAQEYEANGITLDMIGALAQ